tara:strand:+ start:654 stop:1187 length:534 start_codon:yes stop_codon:yes gene_type:complete
LIELLVLLFFAGVIVKIADEFSDASEKENYTGIIFGLIYGLLLGIAMASNIVIATIWAGIIFALILKNKFDSITHLTGLITIALTIIFINNFELSLGFAIIYFFGSLLDEKLNDFFDFNNAKNFGKKALKFIAQHRLVTEIFGIVIAIVLAEPLYWFGVLSFDIGYQLVTKISDKII